MMRLLRLTVLIMTGLLSWQAQAELVVVVHPKNPADSLSRREVVDLYMGRTQYFADGSLVIRLDQRPDSEEREQFYREQHHGVVKLAGEMQGIGGAHLHLIVPHIHQQGLVGAAQPVTRRRTTR